MSSHLQPALPDAGASVAKRSTAVELAAAKADLRAPATVCADAPGRTVSPTRAVPRSADIAALGAGSLLVGLLALAGSLVALSLQQDAGLRLRILGLGVMFIGVGAGLLARRDWARSAALGMLAYGIVAQITQGWLQDDVAAAFVEALYGHPLAVAAPPPGALTGSGSVLGSGWTIGLCATMGWFSVRLAGSRVRAEFSANRRQRSTNDLIRARNG